MIRRPPRSTLDRWSAASDVYKRQLVETEQQYVQPGKGSPWRLQLKDAGARDYTYEAIYLLNTGFRKTTGNVASRDNFLLVSSVPPQ